MTGISETPDRSGLLNKTIRAHVHVGSARKPQTISGRVFAESRGDDGRVNFVMIANGKNNRWVGTFDEIEVLP